MKKKLLILLAGLGTAGSMWADIRPPKIKWRDPVGYSTTAKAFGSSGDVKIQVLVNAQGKVTQVKALEGHPYLMETALPAARRWKYEAAEVDGQRVESALMLTIRFNAKP